MSEFPLHEACMNGAYQQAVELLEENSSLVKVSDKDGRYPIHWAISFQHEEIVDELLSHMKKIDLDSLVDDSNWSPIHIAAAVGNYSIFEKLLKHDIAPLLDECTAQGTTPLHLACSKKHLKIVEKLIERGASVRKKDKKGQLPLHRACAIGASGLVKILCESKSPIDTKDNNGWPPLFHALSEGHGDIAVMLVRDYNAAWEDVKSNAEETALQVAVDKNVREYFVNNVN
ncbi:HBL266Cp [Eremothecium sinecaudum]|uniref:HBL266Cp n=1 Tax=Eremothecium sinecaudum TaxID=45286 RepID=A0A125RDU7_9SACH|nr:HBL266Cp [Eremothecium sinecaudum]AMD18636.1 HBL266Cp [Eremothecium sinecaudum]